METGPTPANTHALADFAALFEAVDAGVRRVVHGQQAVRRAVALCRWTRVAGGRGARQTLLARTLPTLGCRFRRIQFTPDLMPADVTGANIFNQADHR